MSRKRLISRLGLVAAVIAAIAMMGAGSVGAQGVGPSNFPSPNGLNGWYTSPSVTGVFVFYVAGLDGYFEEEDGTFDERLTGLTCSGGPNVAYTPFPENLLPWIPGNPLNPVQQQVTVSGDSAHAQVGCTATYERWYYDDCHFFFNRYCNIEGPWVGAGSQTAVRNLKIDSTSPYNVVVHASSAPNANGWYRSPVTFTVSGQDDTSGILNCGVGGFPWSSPSLTINSNTPVFGSGSGAGCRDVAGNGAGTGFNWKYDSTPPTVSVTGVTNGAVYAVDTAPTPGCSTGDALSGVAANATLATSGGPLGEITANCSGGKDNADNTASASVTYWVNTSLSGFPQSGGVYDLGGANLAGATLTHLDLAGAKAKNANLSGADLSETNLGNADLSVANLGGADLAGANLAGASLKGSNLKGANLADANLSGADLSGAALTGATGLGTADLTGVIWKQTTCPDGTNSNKNGGTCVDHLTP